MGKRAGTHAKERRPLGKVRLVLLLLFGLVFCVSSFMVVTELLDAHRQASAFDDLEKDFFIPTPSGAGIKPSGEGASTGDLSTPSTGDPDGTEDTEPSVPEWQTEQLAKYAQLREENPDFFGWIYIEGTRVSYPVMFTPSDPEHYLHRDFNGANASAGVPFMDEDCYPGCGNYILYGHHMKNGSMFADIVKFADKSFWQEHQALRFDTVDGIGEYMIVAAFYSRVYTSADTNVFRYYYYTDLTDPAVFEEFAAWVKKAARYDTGVELTYGDELVTLSTCNYHTDDGRFVVVAKKVN